MVVDVGLLEVLVVRVGVGVVGVLEAGVVVLVLMAGELVLPGRSVAQVVGHVEVLVVVDNTNPRPDDRRPLVAAARAHDAVARAVWFPASVRECIGRNRRRQGRARVPEVAILATARRLRPPSTEEGFDRVQIARMTADGPFELHESRARP